MERLYTELKEAHCRDKQAKANSRLKCCDVDKQRLLGKWAWLRMEMEGGKGEKILWKEVVPKSTCVTQLE